MQKLVKEYLDELNKRQKKSRKVRIAVILLAVMVVGSVAGVLTQYGVAMTGKAKCGLEEHAHSEDCYEDVLICEITEGEGHTHTAECSYPEELICGLEESEGHTHTEECLFPEELICQQEESEEHTHTEACYQTPEGYACGQEESEGHTHTEACYQTPEGYACGLEEGKGHGHTEECYRRELVCEKEEHTHADICYTDAAADVEDSSVWDRQYAAVEWKGIWGADLAAAAQMQLGYQESANNYIIMADGIHKGYTRYGQFMGDPYIDWDGAFVNFCMHYAGLSAYNLFPTETETAKWCEEFIKIREENAAYLTAPENYTPKTGDLIFFQREGEETGNQMGIVSSYETETSTLRIIEGNSGNEVRENTYNIGDGRIVSYLKISELESAVKSSEGEETEDAAETVDEAEEPEETVKGRTMTAEGPDYTVTVSFTAEAKIPADAVLEVREIARNSEEYLEYYRQSLAAMDVEEMGFARYFDVTFLSNGTEIEPSAPVDVKISYAGSIAIEEDASGNAVHFSKDGTEVLDAGIDPEEHSFTFTQSSFSVVGTVVAKPGGSYYYRGGVPEDLDGKTFLLETVQNGNSVFLTGIETINDDGVRGLEGSRAEELASIENPEEEKLWTFHKVDETTYHIRNVGLGTYLNIDGSNVTMESEAFELKVETDSDLITIRSGKYVLDAGDSNCILAAEKRKSELESHNKFRLFGMGTDYTLTAEGEDYRITLNLSAPEGLFAGVEFTAEEITGETAEAYSRKAQDALGLEKVGFQRFFHLGFDKEIPDELIHVSSVEVQYKDNAEGFDINGVGSLVQFKGANDLVLSAEGAETADAAEDEGAALQYDEIQEAVLNTAINGRANTISAEISELADIGTVWTASTGELYYQTYINSTDDLNGKDFLISNVQSNGNPSLLMGAASKSLDNNASGLAGESFAGGPVVSWSDSMVLWRFEKQNNGTFRIRRSDKTAGARYLNISGYNVSVSTSAQNLTVTCDDGRITIGSGSYCINSYSGGRSGGFAGYYTGDTNNILTLYGKQDVELNMTLNVESADLTGIPITEQTLPPIPQRSSFQINGKNLYVDFDKNHPWPGIKDAEGTEKKYSFETTQIVYKENDVEKVSAVDHLYISNDAQYNLIFYNNGHYVGTFKQADVKIQNGYRAYRLNPLTPVETLDTEGKVNIRMINYQSQQFSGWEHTPNNVEVKQGILNAYLENGYPSFAYSNGYNTGTGTFNSSLGTSLQSYFENAVSANHLFVANQYYADGQYYEYSSQKNGASFDGENFTVYEQLTTTRDSDGTEGDNKLTGKGQFLPYNTFDTNRKTANVQNTYTASMTKLSPSDEKYGEDLYLPDQGSPDYHFGMEISTEFYQMQNGKVGTEPMRYEFTGDDDLWVYIDGVLILDMGGCHDARSGYIDFSTGEVYVQNGTGKEGTRTTLYDLFQNAKTQAVRKMAGQTIINDLDSKLADSYWKTSPEGNKIFADYTKHDFKMWYMERGGGCSNLEVRFNLPVIPPGEVWIEKQLSNSEQGKYANKKFDFQVYLQPIIGDLLPNDEDQLDETAPPSAYRLLNTELVTADRTRAEAFIVQPNGVERKEEIPENGIFQLRPNQKLVLRGLKSNRKYYVRELHLNRNQDEYSGVKVDQIVLDSTDNEGNVSPEDKVELKQDKEGEGFYVDTSVKTVSQRTYVVFKNECSEENRNALLIKKVMGYGENKGDTYSFQIWLENQNGKLELYEGNYYLRNEAGKYYSEDDQGQLTLTDNQDALEEISENTPRLTTKEGSPGIVSGISPGDTVIIRNLLAGTSFLVEEVDPGPQYDTPVYDVNEESCQKPDSNNPVAVEETEGETDETQQKTEMGSIAFGKNAEVTVTNRRYDDQIWHIRKMSRTEGGGSLAAVFELAPSSEGGTTYYGKSDPKNNGEIRWYRDRECKDELSIGALVVGTYILKEIEAAPGYSLSDETWTVEILPGYGVSIPGQTPKEETITVAGSAEERTDYVYTFYNMPLYELPEAGGSGIYWYLISGMLFMMAGALILYRNKCREVQRR